jgi:hypothetical protein
VDVEKGQSGENFERILQFIQDNPSGICLSSLFFLLVFFILAEVVDSSATSVFCCSTNFNASYVIGKILFKMDWSRS